MQSIVSSEIHGIMWVVETKTVIQHYFLKDIIELHKK